MKSIEKLIETLCVAVTVVFFLAVAAVATVLAMILGYIRGQMSS